MEQRHQGATARQPNGSLGGGVAAADDRDPLGTAELRLGRARRVEHADPLVLGEPVDRQPPVLGPGREHHRARVDLVAALELHDVTVLARLQRQRPVRGRRARTELASLGDRAAGQLRAADPGREAEVVLDPARGPGLAAEHGALDHERIQPLGGTVDGGAEAGRAAADDEQVDPLGRGELEADPERSGELAVARPLELLSARQADEGQPLRVELLAGAVVPAVREAHPARELDQPAGVRGVAVADDLDPDPLAPLQQLAAADEGGEQQVGERRILEQQLAQNLALDRDVAHRLARNRSQEHRLAREQVDLAEKAAGAVADDLVAGRVEHLGLALENRDERVRRIADSEQDLARLRGALLADPGEGRELRL